MRNLKIDTRSNLIVITLVIIGTVIRYRGVDRSLNEMFSFRQTQTAWGAKSMFEFGASFTHTQVPVLGPPFEIPFEFPLFQWLHYVYLIFIGNNIDESGRILALIIFQLSVLMIYLIIRNLYNSQVGTLVVFGAEFNSFNIQWGYAVLIDYLSVLLFLLGIYLILKNTSKKIFLPIAVGLFTLGTCVKITTYVVFIPLIIYILVKQNMKYKYVSITIAATMPLIFSYSWNLYADSIKNSNPYTVWLNSKGLIPWNFGTLNQRIDPNIYLRLISRHEDLIFGIPIIILLILVILFFSINKIDNSLKFVTLCLIIGATIGPIIFINLYFVHDYYMIANNLLWTSVISIVLYYILKVFNKKFYFLQSSLLITFITFSTWASPLGLEYFNNLKSKPEDPARSAMLSSNTQKNDLILVLDCNGWDPTLLYYSNRRGLMQWTDYQQPLNFKNYAAIIKCNEKDWKEFGDWIKLSEWEIINSELLIKAPS